MGFFSPTTKKRKRFKLQSTACVFLIGKAAWMTLFRSFLEGLNGLFLKCVCPPVSHWLWQAQGGTQLLPPRGRAAATPTAFRGRGGCSKRKQGVGPEDCWERAGGHLPASTCQGKALDIIRPTARSRPPPTRTVKLRETDEGSHLA